MEERVLTQREAVKAARYFLEQFNEREKSEGIELLIGWMTRDRGSTIRWRHQIPAQWHDWVTTPVVDRVMAERTP